MGRACLFHRADAEPEADDDEGGADVELDDPVREEPVRCEGAEETREERAEREEEEEGGAEEGGVCDDELLEWEEWCACACA